MSAKKNQTSKPVFVVEDLAAEIDNLQSEVQALRQSVQSKSKAVNILQAQLVKQRSKQPTFLQSAYAQTDNVFEHIKEESPVKALHTSNSASKSVFAELLTACKKENNSLKQDILNLRCQLHDAQSDLKLLRNETGHSNLGLMSGSVTMQERWHTQERLHLIHSLEQLTVRVSELENDVRCLTVEKEELLRERHDTAAIVTRQDKLIEQLQKQLLSITTQQSQTEQSECKPHSDCDPVSHSNNLRISSPTKKKRSSRGSNNEENSNLSIAEENIVQIETPVSANTDMGSCGSAPERATPLSSVSLDVGWKNASTALKKEMQCNGYGLEYGRGELPCGNAKQNNQLLSKVALTSAHHLLVMHPPSVNSREERNETKVSDTTMSTERELTDWHRHNEDIENIISLDEIDSYKENLRKCNYTKRKSNMVGNVGLAEERVDAVGGTPSACQTDCIAEEQRAFRKQYMGDGGLVEDSVCVEAFSDYDSDDDQFVAELQQWQQATLGLIGRKK